MTNLRALHSIAVGRVLAFLLDTQDFSREMEEQTDPDLQEEIQEIQLEVNEHPLRDSDNVHVTETDLIKGHQTQRQPRTPLKCSKCNKRFRNPTLLLQHVRLHRGSTVYRCGHCEDTFKELSKFLDHRTTHQPLRKRRKAYDNNGFSFGKRALDVYVSLEINFTHNPAHAYFFR